MSSNKDQVTLSIVSHNQGDLVKRLLADIDVLKEPLHIKEVIVTCNIKESTNFELLKIPLRVIVNTEPKGFGENHNTAFQHASADFFCVLNPDIRLESNPFFLMREALMKDNSGIAVPLVYATTGQLEDSIRRFPTPLIFLKKLLGFKGYRCTLPAENSPFPVDWGAGMCMMFHRSNYELLGGFDEKYFLYYEDVDICTRSWNLHKPVIACPCAKVIHDAQRSSHRKVKYFLWHVSSFIRYQLRYLFRQPDIHAILSKTYGK